MKNIDGRKEAHYACNENESPDEYVEEYQKKGEGISKFKNEMTFRY